MWQTKFALGAAGNHNAAGFQTELDEQAAVDRLVGIERQLALEDRMGPGVQPRA